jgi:hypothetical protein
LEKPQEFHLGRERQGIHFVEQHCTPVSFSNEPDPVVDGPGEGTATVTEKFALYQRLRDGAAVHRNKGVSSATAEIVNRTSKDFLARTRFSSDENGSLARRNARKLLQLGEQDGALTDDTSKTNAPLDSARELVAAAHRM